MMLRSLAVVALFLLASCGSSDDASDDASPTSAEESEGTAAAPDESATTEAPTTAAPTTEPATTEALTTEASGADGSCLVGSWVISQEEMNAYYDALSADTGAGDDFSFDIVGQVTLEFDGVNYVYGADFIIEIDAGGITGEGVSTGGVTGTYTAEDGVITTELGSSDLNIDITVAGVALNGSDLGNGLLTDLPINSAPFDCAGPTLSFQSGADPSVRHDVLLTPA